MDGPQHHRLSVNFSTMDWMGAPQLQLPISSDTSIYKSSPNQLSSDYSGEFLCNVSPK